MELHELMRKLHKLELVQQLAHAAPCVCHTGWQIPGNGANSADTMCIAT